ncbi:MAG: hypothetical protein OEZ13_06070 [Spirochaetia bacterium]|nr:hypothetical protein [Spirochaetia bacterium]
MKSFSQSKKNVILVLLLALFLVCNKPSDKTPWIWQVEGKKYTVSDFEDAHEAFIFLMAQQLNRTPEQLKPFIENPELSGDPRLAKLLEGLKKENFPEIYKRILLINHDADKKGFLKDEKIKKRVQFLQQYFITSLYLDEKVGIEGVNVADSEAINFVEAARKNNPNLAAIPMDQLLEEAKSNIRFRKLGEKREEYVSQIRDSYKINTNENFNLKEYLNKKSDSGAEPEKKEKAENTADK